MIFLWRFCKNTIPGRVRLSEKGVPNPTGCPMCERDNEHALHLLFECDFARFCWHKAGVTYDMRGVVSAANWLLEKLSNEPRDNLIIITKVLEGIWFARRLR